MIAQKMPVPRRAAVFVVAITALMFSISFAAVIMGSLLDEPAPQYLIAVDLGSAAACIGLVIFARRRSSRAPLAAARTARWSYHLLGGAALAVLVAIQVLASVGADIVVASVGFFWRLLLLTLGLPSFIALIERQADDRCTD